MLSRMHTERKMNITYDAGKKMFRLDTASTCYVMAVAGEEGYLGHVYYGPSLPNDDLRYLLRTEEYPFEPLKDNRDGCAFLSTFHKEFAGYGAGDFRESSVCLEDGRGTCACRFLYSGHRIFNGKKTLEGLPASFGNEEDCMTLEIDLKDAASEVYVTLSYSVFSDCDVIARSVKLTNLTGVKLRLNKLFSVTLDMEDEGYRMITMSGAWAREHIAEKREISRGKQSVSSVRGVTSAEAQPFIALAEKDALQEHGRAYGFVMVYSGNFLAQVEKNHFDSLRVSLGIHPDNFSFLLEPGDCFQAPEVLCVCSCRGIGGMSRNFHDVIRNHIIRSPYKDRERPILINNWEATYFDFDTEKLLSIAREAKKSGIEMLVMDDGWFGKRNDDNSSLGDWYVNEEKLGSTLKELADGVNAIGLKFGIWFEPEMVSPDSDLFRAHPDWAIAVPGRTPTRSRNQYVLDLTRKEVSDYVYGRVSSILRSANIAYVKWDMNRYLTDLYSAELPPERMGELSHRYVLAVYALQERLITDFPDLLLENCSSGGARFDPGMLYYSPQIWCSDDTDAIERLSIQEGTALVYPLSAMGAHVSDCPNHTTGRTVPFETRGHVALAGTFGYELDITRIPEEDRKQIPAQTEMYHRYSGLVRNGDYYRIASYAENRMYDCWEVVSKDKSEALVTWVQVMARPYHKARLIRIPGLDPQTQYVVEGMEGTLSGRSLEEAGIMMPVFRGDFRSALIHITKAR